MGDDLYEGTFDEVIDKPDSNGAGAGQTASGSKPQGAALPVIQIDEGNLLGVIEQIEKAILQAPEQRLFQRGGMLVRLKRIAQKETIKGITRDAGSLIIAEATSECVCLEMARTARYTKWNIRAKKYVATDPPIKYARAIAAKNEFSFKTLLATIETPTLRPDGSVLQEGGYDDVLVRCASASVGQELARIRRRMDCNRT